MLQVVPTAIGAARFSAQKDVALSEIHKWLGEKEASWCADRHYDRSYVEKTLQSWREFFG